MAPNQEKLTSVFNRCYHELKSVINSPWIRHVGQRDMIATGEERSELLSCILAADCTMYDSNMRSIVDVNWCKVESVEWIYLLNEHVSNYKIVLCICIQLTFIVAIKIQWIESKHETL